MLPIPAGREKWPPEVAIYASYSKPLKTSITFIPLYLKQQLNVNSTVGLQWKVGHPEKVK